MIDSKKLVNKHSFIILSKIYQCQLKTTKKQSKKTIPRCSVGQCITGTCFIQKLYAPSSSLLQGKHLPFSPSPLRLLWSFRWPNDIVTLPRYFSLRLPHLNIPTGPPHTNWTRISANVACFIFRSLKRIHHFRSGLNWFRKLKKECFKNLISVIWSWTYFYNLHWNNYLYFKDLPYIWEEMIMMALLHIAGLENSECIWKIQRKPEVAVSVSMT
jgi:hypothetical protein